MKTKLHTMSYTRMFLAFLPAVLCSALAGAQPNYGARAFLAFNYLEGKPDLSELFVSSSSRFGYELGAFAQFGESSRWRFTGEAQYKLLGYQTEVNAQFTQITRFNYHYLGFTALASWSSAGPVSIGLGPSINFLVNDPGDLAPADAAARKKIDLPLVAQVGLRYDQLEIQVRYNYSLVPFYSDNTGKVWFRTAGLGLAYYFR